MMQGRETGGERPSFRAVVSGFILCALFTMLASLAVSSPSASELRQAGKDLGHPDSRRRSAAAEVLRSAGSVARPMLRKLVQSADPEVAVQARKLLGELLPGIGPDTPAPVVSLVRAYFRETSRYKRQNAIRQFDTITPFPLETVLELVRETEDPEMGRILRNLIARRPESFFRHLLGRGEIAMAARVLQLTAGKGEPRSQHRLAALLFLTGKTEEVLPPLLGKARQSNTPADWMQVAVLQRVAGHYKEARIAIEHAAKSTPQPNVLHESILLETGDWATYESTVGGYAKPNGGVTLTRLAIAQATNGSAESLKTTIQLLERLARKKHGEENGRIAAQGLLAVDRLDSFRKMLEDSREDLPYFEAFTDLERCLKVVESPAADVDPREFITAGLARLAVLHRAGAREEARVLCERLWAAVDSLDASTKAPLRVEVDVAAVACGFRRDVLSREERRLAADPEARKAPYVTALIRTAPSYTTFVSSVLTSAMPPWPGFGKHVERVGLFMAGQTSAAEWRALLAKQLASPDTTAFDAAWCRILEASITQNVVGDPVAAVEQWMECATDPRFAPVLPEIRRMVAFAALESGDWQAAAKVCERQRRSAEGLSPSQDAMAELQCLFTDVTPPSTSMSSTDEYRLRVLIQRISPRGGRNWINLLGRLSVAARKAGEMDKANRFLHEARLLAFTDGAAQARLAMILAEAGFADIAREQAELAIRLSPPQSYWATFHSAVPVAATLAVEAGDWPRAVQLARWNRLQTSCTGWSSGRGWPVPLRAALFQHECEGRAALAARKPVEALRHFRTALAMLPADCDSAIRMVKCLRDAKCDKQAEELIDSYGRHWIEQLKKHPQSALMLNNLAWFLANCDHDLDRAARLAERAVELEPDTAAYLDTLAEARIRLGDKRKAAKLVQRCLELEPWTEWFVRQKKRVEDMKGRR